MTAGGGAGGAVCAVQLVELGADLNQPNAWGQTALRTAAVSGHLQCMLRLASLGADWNQLQPDCAAGASSPLDVRA
jgi:ankyrin repeat protein